MSKCSRESIVGGTIVVLPEIGCIFMSAYMVFKEVSNPLPASETDGD